MHKMINTPVIFKAEKDFEGDWQLNATAPAAKFRLLRRAINQKLADNRPLRPLAQG